MSGYVNKKLVTIKADSVSSRGNTDERENFVDTTVVSEEKNETVSESLNSSNASIVDFAKQNLGSP